MKQNTFMMIKPDAYQTNVVDKVLEQLEKANLKVVKGKEVDVDIKVIQTLLEHYHEVIDQMGKDFDFAGRLFNSFYFDGPHKVYLMEVSYDGDDIIDYSRTLVGATNPEKADKDTIRGKYSDDNYAKSDAEHRLLNNLIHASDSLDSAKRELELWSKHF